MEEVKKMKGLNTPGAEYLFTLNTNAKNLYAEESDVFILQLLNHYFHARDQDLIFIRQCHSYALD